MKVINKDNIESFKKKNKIKEWASYLFKSFIEGVVIIMVILLVVALTSTPVVLILLFVMPKSMVISLILIIVYAYMLIHMSSCIDDKIEEDKRKW